jgi:hypothetical protein
MSTEVVTEHEAAETVNVRSNVLAGFVDDAGLAAQFGVTSRTLLRWRAAGLIFPSLKLGARRLYSVSAVRDFLETEARSARRRSHRARRGRMDGGGNGGGAAA